jgi:beta-N-acetylhexosaminidase
MAPKDSFHPMRPSRRRIVVRRLAAILLLALLAGAAVAVLKSGGDEPKAVQLPAAAGDGSSGPESHVSFLQRLIPPPAETVRGPAAPRSVADLARRLPLERAVAQLFLFGFSGKDGTAPVADQLKRLDVGGLVVDGRNYDNAQQLAGLTGELAAAAANAHHLPPWIMAEQDGGDYSQFPDLPPTHPPGDFHSAAGATAALTESATTLKALGINGLLQPSLDLSSGETGTVLGARVFSGDPEKVADYARRSVSACRQLRIFCAAKHFPGIGAADTPTDEGPAQVGLSLSQLEARDLVPFAAAVKAGIPGIVVGEGLYETDDFVTPAALSKAIVGGLLRKRLRFGGLAITDDLADPGVSSFAQAPDAAVQAIKAGADMVYISGEMADEEAAYAAVLNAARSGAIPQKRIREALLRVLLTKRGYGLLL